MPVLTAPGLGVEVRSGCPNLRPQTGTQRGGALADALDSPLACAMTQVRASSTTAPRTRLTLPVRGP